MCHTDSVSVSSGEEVAVKPNSSGGSGLTRRTSVALAGAAGLAAVSSFVIMFIGSHTLPAAEGTEFLAFFSLLTGIFGVVSGVQNEATRSIGSVAQGRSPQVRVIYPALATGVWIAVLVALFSPLFVNHIIPISGGRILPILVAEVVLYSGYVCLVGSLSGRARWGYFAALQCSEVSSRMLFMVMVLIAGGGLLGYEGAAIAATLVLFVFLLVSRKSRSAFLSRADGGFWLTMRRNGLAVFSTSCTAVLVTAYGALLKAFAHGEDPLLVGGLILAVSLTRAPIMLPLTSFTGVAIKIFLAHRDAPLRAIAKPTLALLALGLVGAIAAWWVGPWFVPLFNPGYDIPGWVFAVLTFSSAFMAILTLLGTLVLAMDAHGIYAAGWLVASLAALLILASPLALTLRVALSLSCGPLLGAVLMVGWLIVTSRRRSTSSAG